jgi:hypothetical protein
MAIPESQLETWSHQGSVTQSSATYNTIKNALESTGSAYASKDYAVFLQGSYGNDTNIYAESDIDIVIQLDSCFYYEIEDLPDDQKARFKEVHKGGVTYDCSAFKKDVLALLKDKYGDNVKPGDKAIKIEASGSRRKSDVLVTAQYRRYYKFLGTYDQGYHTGIFFFRADNTRIANYPKQHSANCTAKHQTSGQWFKPMARVFKNMRSKLVADGIIEDGVAPSYYIEGLLYNVPNDKFGKNYQDSFVNCINWILQADRSQFLCANELYYLLREGSPVTWRDSKCTEFLSAVRDLWEQW